MIDVNSVFNFELLSRWVTEDPEATCPDVNDLSTFPWILGMTPQFLSIPPVSTTTEGVLSFPRLTLSGLYISLLEGTLETILWDFLFLIRGKSRTTENTYSLMI
jgi:hypothetical protein